jgi:Transglycosylase SLT domain
MAAPNRSPRGGLRQPRRRLRQPRRRLGNPVLVLGLSAFILLVAVLIAQAGGGGPAPGPLPTPGVEHPPGGGDPFLYSQARANDLIARATAGNAHALFEKSPDGALATAARVARYRPLIDSVAAGTGVDPNILEGIVFLESAGRPNAIAGADPVTASGLTQILADTGQSLLGMHIDLAASRRLTAKIDRAYATNQIGKVPRLQAARARVDDRFDPRKALAGTVRYLQLAQQRFGRWDLAIESYHMGIGNLQQVLDSYDGGGSVPYVQLYFDTAPDHHAAAYHLLSGFGDDSWRYYWRVLGAAQVMSLYRSDRSALDRLASLQTASDSAAEVLHPPDQTRIFTSPDALRAAYANHTLVPLPANARALGLAYDPGMGSIASQLHAPRALYRGLRAPALELLVELAARVRAISGGLSPLRVASTVTDERYQQVLGVTDPPAEAGYSFTIDRRYVRPAQAVAFQAILDQLESLNLIAWQRFSSAIEVTVASDAATAINGRL